MLEAMLVNLSLAGAYIASDIPLRSGEIVGIGFRLPGSTRQVELEGRVAWINRRQTHPVHSLPVGFGLSFADLREDMRETLKRTLAPEESVRRE